MKLFRLALCTWAVLAFTCSPAFSKEKGETMNEKATCSEFLNFKLKRSSGETQDLCQYQGKVILVVNTASQCGFTPQYKDLEALYQKYKDKGLVVLGFPSNDFGGQEPGSNEEIQNFCQRNFGVTFPLFAKSSVKKGGDNPLFQKLTEASGQAPSWNFGKYLLDRDGKFAEQLSSRVIGETLEKAVEKLL